MVVKDIAGVGKVFNGTYTMEDMAHKCKSMRVDMETCGYAARQVLDQVTAFASFGEDLLATLEKGENILMALERARYV